MPFFSIVIPTFNRATLIGKTIDSVLQQEFTDYEMIIVDDGSTDNTLNVLMAYDDKIRVFHQSNRGPGAARNLGIQHAKGQYTAFLDSDDLWFPWTLKVCHQAIQELHCPGFLAGSAIFFESELELKESSPKFHLFTDYYTSSHKALWLGTCSVIIQTNLLRQNGGFTSQWINAEDSDLWLRLGTIEGFAFIEAPALFAYRQHSGSAISNVLRTYHGIQFLIRQEKAGQYPGGNARRYQRLEILTRHVRPASLACLRQGEIANAWQLYQQTLRWHLMLGRIRYLLAFLALLGIALVAKFAAKFSIDRKENSELLNSR
jgi:GT2 family glycosyltransferase